MNCLRIKGSNHEEAEYCERPKASTLYTLALRSQKNWTYSLNCGPNPQDSLELVVAQSDINDEYFHVIDLSACLLVYHNIFDIRL